MRWRRYGGRVLAAFAAAVVCWALLVEREPRYGGKTLSQWMVRRQQALTVSEMEEADHAMWRIGRRGLPWMMRWLRGSEPQPWKARLYAVTEKLPTKWVPFKFSPPPSSAQEWYRAETAAVMLGGLGTGATNALPELLRMMSDTRAKVAAGRAFTAISSLGRDALPCLLAALSDASHSNRVEIVRIVGSMRGDLRPAVPVLLSCLRESRVELVIEASRALGGLQLEPEMVVPALSRGLAHADRRVRVGSAEALARFGGSARSVVPELVMALNDADAVTRDAAMGALRNIVPESVN